MYFQVCFIYLQAYFSLHSFQTLVTSLCSIPTENGNNYQTKQNGSFSSLTFIKVQITPLSLWVFEFYTLKFQNVDLSFNLLKLIFCLGSVDTNELYKIVMNVEGFEVEIFAETFDHLVNGEKAGRAFMAKNDRLRNLWLEKFFNKTF